MTQKPDPDEPTSTKAKKTNNETGPESAKPATQTPAATPRDREAQLRDLTEQCLELLDQLAEARLDRDRVRDRCAEIEDELAKTQRDSRVSRQRLDWLEDVLAEAHGTSAHIKVEGFEDLKQRAAEAAAKPGPNADLEQRFQRLGEGLDLEHRIKAALINLVEDLSGVATRSRDLERQLRELHKRVATLDKRLAASDKRLAESDKKARVARELAGSLQKELDTLHAQAEAARGELVELAARSGASAEEREAIRAELERERSDRATALAAMKKLREDERTIQELRAVLGLEPSGSPEVLVDWARNLKSTVDDRDRWVAALLSELSNRRLKLRRRGLLEHERKFLEDHDRAGGS
ncbi:MAG: hypothetical protein ACYST0_01145 [Planctomycetota bacterium]